MRNLGDEIVFLAIRRYFSESAIRAFDSPGRPLLLKRICERKLFRGAILGGGTLIGTGHEGKNGVCKRFSKLIDYYGTGIAFGTGVSGVDFDAPGCESHREHWANALSRCEYVGVRGPDSSATLSQWGVSHEILGDPACFFAQDLGFWEPRENLLAVNFGKSQRMFDDVHRKLVPFLSRKLDQGWKIEFFVVWPEDVTPTLELAKALGLQDPILHKHYFNPTPFLDRIKHARFCIGLKLHAVILACCAGVPSIMLEYNPKCLDFMKSVNLEKYNIRIEEISLNHLTSMTDRLLDEGEEISRSTLLSLHAFKEKQVRKAKELYAELKLE